MIILRSETFIKRFCILSSAKPNATIVSFSFSFRFNEKFLQSFSFSYILITFRAGNSFVGGFCSGCMCIEILVGLAV